MLLPRPACFCHRVDLLLLTVSVWMLLLIPSRIILASARACSPTPARMVAPPSVVSNCVPCSLVSQPDCRLADSATTLEGSAVFMTWVVVSCALL
ncbi:hypothetical protein NMB0505 [Neisseria meningitidis MC58]|uniref:Uncharacterized protein n=1 Tax=Neisseria meningitidis serogroup B (strain ATCC BAA-335 / MC58) TaxID=122586 RepID=Q9K0S3_NEIMB|nr:hypothetical protein NMB0505 [Neisseria meningitidis MC58]